MSRAAGMEEAVRTGSCERGHSTHITQLEGLTLDPPMPQVWWKEE